MTPTESTSCRSPAFQFYPADFLGDVNVIAMTLPERGAYITLLCLCWQNPLPAEPARLARLCGVSSAVFGKLWPALDVCFRADPERPGFLFHPRLERERAKQEQWRTKSSIGGKTAQAKRKQESTTLDESLKPKSDSSSSSLSSSSSSDFSQKSAHARENAGGNGETHGKKGMGGGSGVMGGALHREHLRHSWCGRVCVPDFLHGQFLQATGQEGDALRAFYVETFASIPEDEPVESDALKFWRPRVTAKWPPAADSAKPHPLGQSMFQPGTSPEEITARLTKKLADERAIREARR